MSSRNFKTNVLKPAQQLDALTTYRRLRAMLRNAKLFCVGMLTLLAVSLTGCGHLPPPPCESPKLPTRPALTLPPSSKSYSWNAAEIMKKWQEMLTSGKATQEHYPMLGQGDKNE